MAHRVKIGTSVTSGARQVLQRPSLASLLGAVAAEWTSLESRVMQLYALLMGDYLPEIPGLGTPWHPVAFQVFDTLETQRLRLALLRKLAKWVINEPVLLKELDEVVLESIKKAAKLRNTLIHGQWGIATEYPDALILLPTFGHQLAYHESDFNEGIDKIIEATKSVDFIHAKARKYLDAKQHA
jgi:hypothetical protein